MTGSRSVSRVRRHDDFLREDVFLPELFDDDVPFFFGTFAPALRACDSPIAMACFLLLTFFPDRPLLSVPRFRSLIAFFTFAPAFFPYFAIVEPPVVVVVVVLARHHHWCA
jgi:hypothetical protein